MSASRSGLPAAEAVPPELVARAKAIAAGTLLPTSTRDAATVVLLRDSTAGLEAYLLRRVSTMAFAAGMHVFPGGGVDPRDELVGVDRWAGPAPSRWAGILTASEPRARALVCAAVRETFEESGVLLAGPDAGHVVEDVTGKAWEKDRRALLDRRSSLAELLQRRRLVLRADLLRPWAHWVTPEVEARRYDTRFFVAALPPGQRTRDVGGEADHGRWWRPADAVAARRDGSIRMLPPTVFTLAELASYQTVEEVLAAGAERDVRPVLPRVVIGDADQARLLLPGEAGYR
jgi:8-oxo-dGTP pyrophosphatase MutT (NUDIX family)